jgi:hypothetical protein
VDKSYEAEVKFSDALHNLLTDYTTVAPIDKDIVVGQAIDVVRRGGYQFRILEEEYAAKN